MRRVPVLFTLAVGLGIAFGWANARFGAPPAELPSFTPANPPTFEPLAPPLGEEQLTGRVLSADGEPLVEAAVYTRAFLVPRWAYTDEAGRFEIDDLPSAELELTVLAWPHPIGRFRVRPGEPVELRLEPPVPPPPSLPDVPRRALAGRVLGAGSAWGDPNGYEVVFRPALPPDALQAPVERRIATDASGAFEIRDLALGSYRVSVLPSWAGGGTWPDLAASWSQVLELAPSAPAELEIQLAAGAIEGRLFGDPTQKPIEGAFCLVVRADDPTRIWPPVVSSSEGRFRVRCLPPGRYLLGVHAGGAALADVPVEVRAGELSRPELEPLRVGHAAAPAADGLADPPGEPAGG
jgi:hypothetical protein